MQNTIVLNVNENVPLIGSFRKMLSAYLKANMPLPCIFESEIVKSDIVLGYCFCRNGGKHTLEEKVTLV